ncbi:MAG: hypothetical protein CMM16_06535 [Rhodospirillaceae bacterium]|nr:hypothetical protein [Rhodospirillaceae bacterium]|tara:strand:+ start:656 stop:1567 length:912 start_codon:yes stop_codon:yes gene_type:complete
MRGDGIVRIGTSETYGTFWSQGTTIGKLFTRESGMEVEVLDAGQASIENARRLDEGLIDLGFMASNWIGRAYRGETPFERDMSIRNVAPANSGAMFFVARANSQLREVRDMVGKRISIGSKGSGMVHHIHTIFGALGISFEDFTPVYLSFEEGGKALEAGDVDVQWQCPYPNPVMAELAERLDVRVLDYAPDDLATVLRQVDFYRPREVPAGFFRGVEKNTEQLAVVNIISAHENTDPELVRKFVGTMLSNLDEIAEMNALFSGLGALFAPLKTEGRSALEFGDVPLHSGALQAYRDAGFLSE